MCLYNPGVIVHTCNPSAQEIKVEDQEANWRAVLIIFFLVWKTPGSQTPGESFSPPECLELPGWL